MCKSSCQMYVRNCMIVKHNSFLHYHSLTKFISNHESNNRVISEDTDVWKRTRSSLTAHFNFWNSNLVEPKRWMKEGTLNILESVKFVLVHEAERSSREKPKERKMVFWKEMPLNFNLAETNLEIKDQGWRSLTHK